MVFLVEVPVTVLLFREVWGMESVEKAQQYSFLSRNINLSPFKGFIMPT